MDHSRRTSAESSPAATSQTSQARQSSETAASNSAVQEAMKGPTPWTQLEHGDKEDPAVKTLQQRLVDHDLDRFMGKAPTDGHWGGGTTTAIEKFQARNGLAETGTVDAATMTALSPRTAPVYGDFQNIKSPSAQTIQAGKDSGIGKLLGPGLDANLATYQRASQLTGVPVELLAMIHGNESNFNTNESATKGKEAGWGLDPDWVSTKWGREQIGKVERINGLDKGSLGTWDRKSATDAGNLRSAIIAAEHLKRNAAYAKVPIHQKMTSNDLAGAMASWRGGPTPGRNAKRTGKHHLWNPDISSTPHAYHPGGTSHGANGRHSVSSGEKAWSLRGDVWLPMIQEELTRRKVTPAKSED